MTRINKFSSHSSTALKLAFVSFASGTLIFIIFQLTAWKVMIPIGLGLLIIAFIFNLLLFVHMLIQIVSEKVPYEEGLFVLYCQLLNLPIAIFYISICLS